MNKMVSVGTTLGTVFALALVCAPSVIAAGGVVGTGTPLSCTDQTFSTVFFNAQATGGGTITFNCGASPHVIEFGAAKLVSANTELRGGDLIALSGRNATVLFQVSADVALTLANITLTRGNGIYGAIENFGVLTVRNSQLVSNNATLSGGAILNHGTVALTNAVIANNTAARSGGGIYADGGTTTIVGSRFATNHAVEGGGGIATTEGTSLTINTSEFVGNTTGPTGSFDVEGGGIRSAGTLTISDSMFRRNYGSRGGALAVPFGVTSVFSTVIVGNDAVLGGGIFQRGGTLNLTDVTLAGNGYDRNGLPSTDGGGAVYKNGGASRLNNVTISGNRAMGGGGIEHANGTALLTNVTFSGNDAVIGGALLHVGGSVSLTNVTLAGNTASSDTAGIANRGGSLFLTNTVLANPGRNCSAAIATASFSLSSDGSCGFGAGRDNALLPFGPLANNGGFTFTHVPLTGNAAIDSGTDVGCTKTDQRGAFRPFGFACDAGAVERILGVQAVVVAVEYFHAAFGHYFVTYITDEIAKLDSGFFEGWVRTGDRFNVYQTADAGRAPVCRFFTLAFPPKSSHFYAPRGLGCEGTLLDLNWRFEGDVFYAPLPFANGDCPNGHKAIYRLYNNGQGGAPNHRFTTNPDTRDQMLALGYIAEGAGIGVGMCSPL